MKGTQGGANASPSPLGLRTMGVGKVGAMGREGARVRGRCLRPLVAFCAFVVGLNIFYSMNILIDHDAIDTHELVHSPSLTNDWGESQVRATANWAGPIWCFFFGGINYQIEHHLFPTVYH